MLKDKQITKVLRNKHQMVLGVVVVSLVMIAGVSLLLLTHAASQSVAVEPETGTITSPASQINDASASGGRAIQFGPQATSNCTITDKLVNPCHPWLGAEASGYGGVPGDSKSQILYHEHLIGRQVDIARTYHGADKPPSLTANDKYFINRPNTILDADWIPGPSFVSVANGSKDAAIDTMAASIKSVAPKKIMFTLWHEPESEVTGGISCTPRSGAAGGTPQDFVAMYRHVWDRFHADGVNNVVWVVTYMGYSKWDNCGSMIKDLWPGNQYVDWVMWDPYAHGTQSFNSLIGDFYNWLTTHSDTTHDYLSKAWGINEWNAGDDMQRQARIDLFNGAKAAIDNNTFPRMKTFNIFDSKDSTVACFPISDKHLNPPIIDQGVLAAYKGYANTPAFRNP